MSNGKHKLSKKMIVIIMVIIVLLVGLSLSLYIWVIPRYSLSINGTTSQTSSSVNGIRRIAAKLDVKCNLAQSGSELNCEKQIIKGTFGSNRKVTLSASKGANSFKATEGKISFEPEIVSIKSVVIRPKPIKDPILKQYTITMTNTDTNKIVAIYSLTIRTVFTDADLNTVNKSPTAEAIVSAVQKISTVSNVCITNENNDPNDKIGKPGTYFIKVTFRDSRSTADNLVYDESLGEQRDAKDTCEIGNDAGGSIEVFRNQKDAKSREDELQARAGGFFDSGTSKAISTSVIRTSSDLKASEQKDLESQLVTVLTE